LVQFSTFGGLPVSGWPKGGDVMAMDIFWIVALLFVLGVWLVSACRERRMTEDVREAALRAAVHGGALILNESRAMRDPAFAYDGRVYPVHTGELHGETPWERGEI
jgi:hypothetical protein